MPLSFLGGLGSSLPALSFGLSLAESLALSWNPRAGDRSRATSSSANTWNDFMVGLYFDCGTAWTIDYTFAVAGRQAKKSPRNAPWVGDTARRAGAPRTGPCSRSYHNRPPPDSCHKAGEDTNKGVQDENEAWRAGGGDGIPPGPQ